MNVNCRKEERAAIKELWANEGILIKRADQGGAAVVWGRHGYITEAKRQLNNKEYYEHLVGNPIELMKTELMEQVQQAKNEEWI
uniref:GIY-YIG catalytic domain n=1 Tax=Iconisemion striatum TaxID=60296 RepID=A0A1A7Z0C6_9TELE